MPKVMRPYVVCHMLTSVNGAVTGDFLSSDKAVRGCDVYYEINRRYGEAAKTQNAKYAFACGRVTMEGSFTNGYYPDLTAFEGDCADDGDYIAENESDFFAVAFDRFGRLGWQGGRIVDDDPGYNGAHIIEVLTESAPKQYLSYLKSIGVSYIFAGKVDTDIHLALQKLYNLFGIRLLLLEGGSIINGAFCTADAIDEISTVTVPVVAKDGLPLFYESSPSELSLVSSEVKCGDIIHSVYKRKR